MTTDPIADFLTRIRNGILARHAEVVAPNSKLKVRIAEVLKTEGYVTGHDVRTGFDGHEEIVVKLRWADPRTNAITGLRRWSRPGQRAYVKHTEIPKVRSGLGIAILSTSRGLMTDRAARKLGVGGELLCEVWDVRIGRKPLSLPKGVTLNQKDGKYGVKGPKGELAKALPTGITIKLAGDKLTVERADDSHDLRAKHGLVRAHLANMVKGVTDGWTRELEINGVGYRAEVSGDKLTMALGYSHPVIFNLPKVVQAKVDKNKVILTSADRDILGQTAAKVRELRPPEPYKGKGVKYAEEVIKKKAGKAGATGGGGGGG